MSDIYKDEKVEERKIEHIKIILGEDVNYHVTTWFEHIHLIHNSLPEINLKEINMGTVFLGRNFKYPILIDSMTGGTKLAKSINKSLAELACKYNIPISCGSQKAGIINNEVVDSYRVIREVCPEGFVIGNIGGHDLAKDPENILNKVISMIDADAVAIHLNPLQEAVQHESDADYSGVIDAIEKAVDLTDKPIIVKETGAGISLEVAKVLESIGVDAINISGAGGTSWAAVEVYRNQLRNDFLMSNVGKTFWNWGIPTAASIMEVVSTVDIPVIASGGVRTGIHIVKSLVLGASLAGIAQPFLKAYFNGEDGLERFMNQLIHEIRITMFLVGSQDITSLRENVDYVITGDLLEWLRQRNILMR